MRIAVRCLLVVGFLATTQWLTVGTQGLFVSPDESANAFFAQTFSQSGVFCDYNSWRYLYDLHPRSMMNVYDGCLSPQSFLGLPLLGGIGYWILGMGGMLMVTPIMAVLGIIALWDTLRRTTKDVNFADAATFIFLFHPAFWYYSGRLMMHNVPFIACVMMAVWCLVMAYQKFDRARFIGAFSSGIMLGAALMLRTSEVLWLAPLFIIIFVALRKQLWWRAVVFFVIGLALPLMLLGCLQIRTYGSALTNGYTYSAPRIDEPSVSVPAVPNAISSNLLLPFGFHPRAALHNTWDYGLALFPWAMLPALLGVALVMRRTGDRSWKYFLAGSIILSAYLTLIYGSWVFADNPDPRAITIGNSHVRYWLPIFVLSSIFAGLGVTRLLSSIGRARVRQIVTICLAISYLGLSAHLVFFSPDGFVPSRAALDTFAEKREMILANTESTAVIVVDRADKYLFPDREVLVPLRSDQTYATMSLLDDVPLYYFGLTLPEVDVAYLNEVKLGPQGQRIELMTTIQDETLYRIVKVSSGL